MSIQSRTAIAAIAAIGLFLGFGARAFTRNRWQAPSVIQRGASVTMHATGTFEIKVTPQEPENKVEGATLGRMSFDKQFHGDLEGTSKGQGLTAATNVKGSAGYVALEWVSGTLQGRSGSFVLQHSGTMTRGALELTVAVVPDSGTGQLAGLAGKMTIKITNGQHFYDFEYTLAQTP